MLSLQSRCYIQIWDLRDWKVATSVEEAHSSTIRCLDFANGDSNCIASSGDDCRVKLWDKRYQSDILASPPSKMVVAFLLGGFQKITSMAFWDDWLRVSSTLQMWQWDRCHQMHKTSLWLCDHCISLSDPLESKMHIEWSSSGIVSISV